jgi:hypothetical protein
MLEDEKIAAEKKIARGGTENESKDRWREVVKEGVVSTLLQC